MPDKPSLQVWIFKYGDVYLYLKCSSLTVAFSAALCQDETQLPFLQVWVLGSGKRAFHMLHGSSLASVGNPEVKTCRPATLACLTEAARLQRALAPRAGRGRAGSRAALQTPRAPWVMPKHQSCCVAPPQPSPGLHVVLPLPTPCSGRRGPAGAWLLPATDGFWGQHLRSGGCGLGRPRHHLLLAGGAERDAGCRVTQQGLSGCLLGMGFRGLEPAVGWFHSAAVS